MSFEAPAIQVEIVFDAVCPWCFIGKRRLEQALRLRPGVLVARRWRPFLLNPDMPASGIDRTNYLIKKFGSETRMRRVFGVIANAGQSVEIDFAFDRIHRTPNTVDAHRLVRFAAARGRDSEAVEALFFNYFINGRDIGNREILVEIGTRLGLDGNELAAHLESEDEVDTVYRLNAEAHRLGINGVPSFVFDRRMVISGAQEPQVLARILDVARETTPRLLG